MRTKVKKIGLFVFGVMPLFLLTHTYSSNSASAEEVRLGEHVLEIPFENLAESMPFWLRLIPGLAPSRGEILLKIEAEEIAIKIPDYQAYEGKIKNNIFLRIEVLDEEALKQILDPEMHVYSDIWYGRGLFRNRIIEEHEKSGFYKVYKKGIKNFWSAVKILPDTTKPIPEDPFSFWVAGCFRSSTPMTKTGETTSCQSKFVHHDLLLDFSVNEINLRVIDDVKAELLRKILSWKK